MILYHGSNVEVGNPEVRKANRGLDFGNGFYTTTNPEQAETFANIVVSKRGGVPIISFYEYDEAKAENNLKIKRFANTGEWFDFIVDNRSRKYKGESYDIIIGKVANDRTYRVIITYLVGEMERAEAIAKLDRFTLYDQVVFCSEKAFEYLKFTHSKEVCSDE